VNRIFLWLDDVRPAPRGFTHVKTIDEAKAILETGRVALASLDHDLGACDECSKGVTPDEWLEKSNYASMPNCPHFGTGYDLVRWMEETGHWPTVYWPTVHSANAVGRRLMEQAIERVQQRRAEAGGRLARRETQPADGLEGQASRLDRVARHMGARRIESVRSRADRNKKTKGTHAAGRRPSGPQRPRRAKPRRKI